ncbi:MAG TPA: hypothetical protein VE567_08215 [Sphingomonas sp.]|nr:hypothetical protein [Sphingomonas sp.]
MGLRLGQPLLKEKPYAKLETSSDGVSGAWNDGDSDDEFRGSAALPARWHVQ